MSFTIDVVNIHMVADPSKGAPCPLEAALAESGGDPAHAAYLALTEAAAALQSEVAQIVAEHGLSLSQYSALRAVRRRENMRLADLAQAMVHRAPDASRLIERLVRLGLVSRHPDEGDRRALRLCLTKSGQECLATTDELITALHRRQFAAIESEDTRQLVHLLLLVSRGEKGSSLP